VCICDSTTQVWYVNPIHWDYIASQETYFHESFQSLQAEYNNNITKNNYNRKHNGTKKKQPTTNIQNHNE
jgi:hypothetical protein